ncbi:Gfo/Idh/MocA family protein [Prevotella sp.]|uniref:Gfo/Idh/MocA family protein n=1 Tax=Prevotella sp. TaxID=59823 RepID=UPI0040292C78
MKITRMLLIVGMLLLSTTGFCSNQADNSKQIDKTIKVVVPQRPAGQKDVLALRCDPIKTVRIGFVGLGARGTEAVRRFTYQKNIEVVALCDLHQWRVDSCQRMLQRAGMPRAARYYGAEDAWKKLCQRKDIDLVYIATDWVNHAPIMLYAMEKGKHVACEVPAALTLDEIWKVVDTAERTRRHCMMLENCVYDFFEITTLNMARKGVFGDITHVKGAYNHCLWDYWGDYNDNWRMLYNIANRGDVYPTHGLGPACQLLNIHRGDRMQTLVAMDCNPVSLPAYLSMHGKDAEAKAVKNGEQTLTLIRTVNGKLIHIEHNVASPRPYSRMYQLSGTRGFANKYPVEGYALESKDLPVEVTGGKQFTAHEYMPEESMLKLMQMYKDPIVKDMEQKAKEVGGHGGMDFIMDSRLIYCLRNGLPLDMDVYDLAEWCSLIPLTKLSLENGSMPVEVPDFTRGAWNRIKGYSHAFVE